MNTYAVASYKMAYTIGVGTFGRVKLATHEKTGQKVAIKIINRAKMESLEMSGKLLREISILQKLGSHPHIIRLYELIDTPSDIFVVMEFVPGGELFDYIVQRARLNETDARRFFQQIISGVEYCHEHMVCHRDLKPENVLLVNENSVKIGDFGLSNIMTDGDFLKTSCGSPNYAAPEVVSGKSYIGPEVDIWSCGVILYALVCGTLPFDDEHVPNLFKKIKTGNYVLPGHLSPSVKTLISRLLLVDPADRITLREIKRHPWMNMGSNNLGGQHDALADYAVYLSNTAHPEQAVVDLNVINRVKELGYELDPSDLRKYDNSVLLPKAVVAYRLLCDKLAQGSSKEVHKTGYVYSKELRWQVSTASAFFYDSRPGGHQLLGEPTHDPIPVQWKLGFETNLEAITLMTAVYHCLKSLNYQWSSIHPYKVIARKVNDTLNHVLIQVFKSSPTSNQLCLQNYYGPAQTVAEHSLYLLYGLYKMAHQVAARIQPATAAAAATKKERKK